jgi:hypothetical protein
MKWFTKTEIGRLVMSWILFVIFASLSNIWEVLLIPAWLMILYWVYFIIRSIYESVMRAVKERNKKREICDCDKSSPDAEGTGCAVCKKPLSFPVGKLNYP